MQWNFAIQADTPIELAEQLRTALAHVEMCAHVYADAPVDTSVFITERTEAFRSE